MRAVYHLYVVRVPAERRERFQEALKAAGIDTGIHYPDRLAVPQRLRAPRPHRADFPDALKASQEIVSLPMFPELSVEQTDYIVGKIREFGL